MKTAIFLLGGVLVASTLFLSEAASLYRYSDDDAKQYEDLEGLMQNKTNCTGGKECYFYPWPYPKSLTHWKPVSHSILGNLVLVFLYGIILGYSAKLISDGAELLLDLGLPAGIIGGVVLPLLGAVPDSAMIVFSGMGGTKEQAQQQIDVGMGTLAGSTIMLLTIPWLGSLILGRVDIINGQGRDKQCSPFTLSSLWKQGITVLPDVTRSAIVMLITMLPYFIVQGADWHYGPTKPSSGDPDPKKYIKDAALVTGILSLILFVLYLVYQVYDNVNAQRKMEKRNEEKRKQELVQRVLKQFILGIGRSGGGAFGMTPKKPTAATAGPIDGDSGETQPLVPSGNNTGNLQKKYFGAWRMSKGKGAPEGKKEEEKEEKKPAEPEEEESEEPRWKVAIKCAIQLILGVGMVTLFSDPMVDALTDLTDDTHKKHHFHPSKTHSPYAVIDYGSHIPIGTFYISFVVTPLCSNASELVSSLVFASKKTKVNSSMTYSQLYGAATMNNTLCLGIFALLVYMRDLDWEYSAEVTVIIFIEVLVGLIAIISGFGFKNTYFLFVGFIVGALYFLAILLVFVLEQYLDWK
ncbi:uncharacterized protein [Dysidea avara]|uniref:uncharacterized protein n=1 Tax=Dysidea avara TaxID=196820 RepID=UPI003318DD77